MNTATQTRTEPLTRADRCDACGAHAKATATSPNGVSTLLFCGHHTDKHAPGLASQGWSVER